MSDRLGLISGSKSADLVSLIARLSYSGIITEPPSSGRDGKMVHGKILTS